MSASIVANRGTFALVDGAKIGDQIFDAFVPKSASFNRGVHFGDVSLVMLVVMDFHRSSINMRFQRLPPHPIIIQPTFRPGGTGEAKDWLTILVAVEEVREAAKRFLDFAQEPDLDRVIPYDGSITFLRTNGLPLHYALMRIAAHHYIHIGEIVTVRSRLGHVIEDFPDWGRSLI